MNPQRPSRLAVIGELMQAVGQLLILLVLLGIFGVIGYVLLAVAFG